MNHLNYDKLFAKNEYTMIINYLVELINLKYLIIRKLEDR